MSRRVSFDTLAAMTAAVERALTVPKMGMETDAQWRKGRAAAIVMDIVHNYGGRWDDDDGPTEPLGLATRRNW